MEVLHGRCAGLDVHKDSVVACVRIQEGSTAKHVVETFGTTTQALLKLADWLTEHKVTHAAMEATGVYWKPVWHVLEESVELVLANAMHIKNVPGRKTDVKDATWIADLLAHGLIRSSFVPPTPIQELRTLMRTRKQLVRERAQHIQRIQKTLEDANLKIASVVSDITGISGRAVLKALIQGETQPEKLLEATTGRLHADRNTLIEALRGRVRPHHRFLLQLHLKQIESLEQATDAIDAEAGTHLEPFREKVARLVTIPGIKDVAAQVIVSEIGIDMTRFPTAAHLLGRPLPAQRRERRQAAFYSFASGGTLAQDHARPVCVVGSTSQDRLPACSVPALEEPSWSQESHHCRGCFHAHRRLLHAPRQRGLSRPRLQPLRPHQQGQSG